jgi:LmbE family N-acetylglucosaminyl deacetylase
MNLNDIVTHKIPCYFLSPHLDDAALSAGGLLSWLQDKTEVQVITFFTQADHGPESLSVKSFLKQCGYSDANTLYTERRAEDKAILEKFQLSVKHQNYVDALWRKIPHPAWWRKAAAHILAEFLYVYPIYRIHIISGKVSPRDNQLQEKIREDIATMTQNNTSFALFAPIGIGKNVDHLLIRTVAQKYFPDNTIYWTDFPYSLHAQADQDYIKHNNLKMFSFDKNLDDKIEMIKGYHTQVDALFSSKQIPKVPEVYYTK